jgi:hypothetical protein
MSNDLFEKHINANSPLRKDYKTNPRMQSNFNEDDLDDDFERGSHIKKKVKLGQLGKRRDQQGNL